MSPFRAHPSKYDRKHVRDDVLRNRIQHQSFYCKTLARVHRPAWTKQRERDRENDAEEYRLVGQMMFHGPSCQSGMTPASANAVFRCRLERRSRSFILLRSRMRNEG